VRLGVSGRRSACACPCACEDAATTPFVAPELRYAGEAISSDPAWTSLVGATLFGATEDDSDVCNTGINLHSVQTDSRALTATARDVPGADPLGRYEASGPGRLDAMRRSGRLTGLCRKLRHRPPAHRCRACAVRRPQ